MSKRFPQVLDALASGAVNLTNLDLLRDVMTEDNADILLEGATGRTKHEVEVRVACLDPKPDVPSNITRLRDNASSKPPWQPPPKPLSPGRSKIQMTGDDELCAMIARAQQLTRHENPGGDMAVIFKAALAKLLPILEKEKLGEGIAPRASKPPKDPRDARTSRRRARSAAPPLPSALPRRALPWSAVPRRTTPPSNSPPSSPPSVVPPSSSPPRPVQPRAVQR